MQLTPTINVALLCNTLAASGGALAIARQVGEGLTNREIAFNLLTQDWPTQFEEYTHIFIVGGDGTLNYFINRYPAVNLPIAIFRGGTGNDFHWLLYGDLDPEAQLDRVLAAGAKPIDIGRCNDRYFINGVGIGFEGEVARALFGKKKKPGKRSFLATILKKVFTYRSRPYQIKSAETNVEGRKLLVDISNGRRAGGGFQIAPIAQPDDGLFDVIVVDSLNPLERLRYLPVIEKGKHLSLPFIRHFLCSQIDIGSDNIIQYHLDGEYYEAGSLHIELIPSAFKFLY